MSRRVVALGRALVVEFSPSSRRRCRGSWRSGWW